MMTAMTAEMMTDGGGSRPWGLWIAMGWQTMIVAADHYQYRQAIAVMAGHGSEGNP